MHPQNLTGLAERYNHVLERIRIAANRADRPTQDIQLVAVSKGRAVDEIEALYGLGQRDFGENYADEFEQKRLTLAKLCPQIRWHYLGRIQSNKAKQIAHCDVLHTLDSLKHAQVLLHVLGNAPMPPCFVQVNLSNDPKRSGVSTLLLRDTFSALRDLKRLSLLGLMAILPLEGERSHWLELLGRLKDGLEQDLGLRTLALSLGMSEDFEEAIVAGATHLRIGSAIFGH
jgi:pyridoxal phosphate enzyme (YggS family)